MKGEGQLKPVISGPFQSTLATSNFFIGFAISSCAFLIPFKWEFVVYSFLVSRVVVTCHSLIYHTYFAHRAFKVHNVTEFIMGLFATLFGNIGNVGVYSMLHLIHHPYADHEGDPHSPTHGAAHAFFLWRKQKYLGKEHDKRLRTDLYKYLDPRFEGRPGMIFLSRWGLIIQVMMYPMAFLFGHLLTTYFPQIGLDGPTFLIYFWAIPMWYGQSQISVLNVFGHSKHWGFKNFDGREDQSRNSIIMCIFNSSTGWHNNHHQYPFSAKSGLIGWEVYYDPDYWIIKTMEFLGLAWDVRVPTKNQIEQDLKFYKNKLEKEENQKNTSDPNTNQEPDAA
jgi:stearoyl-CoA desaturase (delta-9 desaturase)